MSSVQPGDVIDGKYRVLRSIGEGGMGAVYEGENLRIGRRVAIKVLHAHVAQSTEFSQRFEREARASARIGSPHVCDVLDLGDLPDGERYLVMEFLEGESLEDRLTNRKLSSAELAPILFEILEGLGTMHAAGVIHRDLKPANVFLQRLRGKGETVKILDFGVAKLLPRAGESAAMTSTGIMMGTPLYMSPEQAKGAREVDGRTDIFAACVIAYRALTGVTPHTGDNLNALLFKIVLEDPPPIRSLAPEVDAAFADLITKGLSRDPAGRYATAHEFLEAIAAWGTTQSSPTLRFALEPRDPSAVASVPVDVTGMSGAPSENIPVSAVAASAPMPRRPSGGTPVAWVEDPDGNKKALGALPTIQSKSGAFGPAPRSVQSGMTQPFTPLGTGPHLPVGSTPPPKRRAGLVVAVGLTAIVLATGIGFRLTGGKTTAAATPPPSALPTAAASVSEVASSPVLTVASATAEPVEEPSATTSLPVKKPTPIGRPPSIPVATAAPSAKTSATVAASAPPTPSAAASAGHRKFRTNLE